MEALRVSSPYDGNVSLLREALGAPAPPEAPKAKPMQWAELEGKDPPQRTWIIDHWLGASPTLFAGAGGVGKSLLAQTILTALATGKRFIDAIAAPQVCLGWFCEDDHDELWRRQVAINAYLGVTMADLVGKLHIEPRLGRENGLYVTAYGTPTWTPVKEELREQVNDYKAQVLALDNIGQTFGCSEVDRHHVTSFVNGIVGLTETPVSNIFMGHPAKSIGSEFSGSTAWENAVRMRWYMGTKLPDEKEDEQEEADKDVRYFAKRKTNYSVRDYRKLIYLDGVFRTTTEPGPISERYGFTERQQGAEETVLFALESLTKVQVHTRCAPTSPDYLPKKMAEMKLAGEWSKRDLKEAMNRLVMSGRIGEREVGKLANRQPRMGLVRL